MVTLGDAKWSVYQGMGQTLARLERILSGVSGHVSHPAYYHPGDNPGYRSFSAWLPDQAASLVVLANDDGVRMTDLLKDLLPAALEP